ncbi:MAG TPA: adenylate/guanylate cyclase domain-containing protein [Bradyrhizobium sp.]|nr:adenylate/guanylate cyclase domain-containing protein [Bradyrhizobium sp.]
MPTPISSAEAQVYPFNRAPAVKRRLAAILCADVESYTRHVHEDEVGTFTALKSHLDELIEPQVSRHGGRVFNTTGDGLLAEFDSAVSALNCAVEIQTQVARRNAAMPGLRQLQFRIGLNLGEVVIDGDDLQGSGVIIASRLQAIAGAGGICLSEDLYRQVHGKVNFKFEDLGLHSLKNIAGPAHLFRIADMAPAPSTISPQASPASLTSQPTLAVLPFDNLSGDADQGYFSDGITNDLITDLSRFPDMGVIASHSVFTYKGKAVEIETVARELGVRYVVEGSVQRSGNTVRINAQLINALDNRHLWSERYKRDLTDLFAIQDEIARSIAAIVVARVELSELDHALRKPTESLAAYDHYLRGKAVWYEWTPQANQEARDHFRAAIALDPKFARAYSALSFVVFQSALGGWAQAPMEALREGRELAERAIDIDRMDFEIHAQLGFASLYCRDFNRCIASYEKALELNPNSPDVLAEMADALVHLGRTAEGVEKIAQAKRLNPFCPDWYDWVLGIAAFHDGRYEDALTAFRSMHDRSNFLLSDLVATYVRLGRMEEAKNLAAEMLKRQPNYRLATERLRPFKDPKVLQGFIADLQRAGLTD